MIAWSQWKLALGVAAIVLLAAGTATVLAQKKNSAETVNTAAAEDRSTPIGALRFFAHALERFDATNVAASLHAQNPAQERFQNAMVSVVRSEGALRKALEEKFGTNGVAALPERPMFAMSFGQEKLDAAEIEVHGTNAIVRTPGRDDRSDQMRLMKIGGVWKFSGEKGDSPQAGKAVESIERISAALETFTTEITNGGFRTAEEALRAMRTRIGAAMRPKQ
jgi:hypothetical protein